MGEVILFPKKVAEEQKGEKQSYIYNNINKSLISILRLGLGDYMASLPEQPEVLVGVRELFDEVLEDMEGRDVK